MNKFLTTSAFFLSSLFSFAAQSQTASVQDAWIRATVPQQKATGAFMKITADQPMRLIGVTSPAAPVAEIHEMRLQDNVMKMRQVAGIDLPAGQAVELKPGGYHVMLMDLPQPVKAGDSVPLQLVLETAAGQRRTLDIQVPVRSLNTPAGPSHPASGSHMGHSPSHH
ncbi:copper chaperone PCu(A)C [Acidovorax sp. GBBC 3334]|uniref:copper chaperone PCu(A)C n=1 Tax=Acidovorax sp. GBBC 3334 TaxID=2940496 RepID=UPI0023027C1C|nr:copper chaperone PCu(A)C [Acidovorax sp. GBBC 3334]MDA8454775.1 copper chaperone PCu(A)C [Acidovorax sp. GBBC 3334]